MTTTTSTRRGWLLGLALVVALGLAFIPAALPTGPSANLDAAGALGAGKLGAGALLVFLGGLLTALTPCVYPLIPITVGVFGARPGVGRGKAVSSPRATWSAWAWSSPRSVSPLPGPARRSGRFWAIRRWPSAWRCSSWSSRPACSAPSSWRCPRAWPCG
jgi:hypothetical protein